MAEGNMARHQDVFEQLHAIKTNDEQALKKLYRDNYVKVEMLVLNNNGSADQAKDIFQEAFIAVWRNVQMDKFHPTNHSAIDGYLYQIAKNKWMDYLRSGDYNKVVRMDNINIAAAGIESTSETENEYLAIVKKYFKHLGEDCKTILTMFYYDDKSSREISQSMGWTEATARNNKYRCIQKLKELINNK